MDIIKEVEKIRQTLLLQNNIKENPIDLRFSVIPPYRGNSEIKLIILGQDPTIRKVNSRGAITCTLNLNKSNALKSYVQKICSGLDITIENVYATNLFKYFYTFCPSQTMDVLRYHLNPNIALLDKELQEFEGIPIITLGEPVLQLLTNEFEKVKAYWNYDSITKSTGRQFSFSNAKDNLLKRDFFPFPHQPSLRKEFYKNTLAEYLKYTKNNMQFQLI